MQGLNGSLPAEWGSPGALQNLKKLNLRDNGLTGTLPAAWRARPPPSALLESALHCKGMQGVSCGCSQVLPTEPSVRSSAAIRQSGLGGR